MADISNLKINAHSNVDLSNLREALKWEMKIEKLKRQNWFMSKYINI